jgi:hypothetical protein
MSNEEQTKGRIQEACRELDSALKLFELVDTSVLKTKQDEHIQRLRTQISEIKKQIELLST